MKDDDIEDVSPFSRGRETVPLRLYVFLVQGIFTHLSTFCDKPLTFIA